MNEGTTYSIETTQLAYSHNHAGGKDSTPRGRCCEDSLKCDPEGRVGHALSSFLKGQLNGLDLRKTLLICRGGIDLQQHVLGGLVLSVTNQLTR